MSKPNLHYVHYDLRDYRIKMLERDNIRLQALSRETLSLIRAFFGLCESPERKIVFSDRKDVDLFLDNIISFEKKLSKEVDRFLLWKEVCMRRRKAMRLFRKGRRIKRVNRKTSIRF